MFVCCVGVVCFCDLNQEICNRITSYNWPAEESDWKGYSEKTKNNEIGKAYITEGSRVVSYLYTNSAR